MKSSLKRVITALLATVMLAAIPCVPAVGAQEYYVNDGSHGCINTPDAAMKYLFYNLDDNTPVLMYGRNTWYDVNAPSASPVTKDPIHGQTAK